MDGPLASSILVCYLSKSAKHMPIVEFADLEIGCAAERYRTSMAKHLPKLSCTLYRGGRTRAIDGFTSNDAAVNKVERHCYKKVISAMASLCNDI
jgi:hypothetical protein